MDASAFDNLKNQAKSICQPAWDVPEQRLKIREVFYEKYGFGKDGSYGYGNSELSFIKWEIHRGVLNPLNDPDHPGSDWWKTVNWYFLYHGTLAGLLYEQKVDPEEVSFHPSSLWLRYIYHPSPQNWYAAHNATISHGYDVAAELALAESEVEQLFIRHVLVRLYFAQTMVMGEKYAFGIFGKFLANPNGNAVEHLVHIPDFYPDQYPLTHADSLRITYQEFSLMDWLEKIFDQDIIGPHLEIIVNSVASWIQYPKVQDYVFEKQLIYPKTNHAINDPSK